jgi:hypothetical protein
MTVTAISGQFISVTTLAGCKQLFGLGYRDSPGVLVRSGPAWVAGKRGFLMVQVVYSPCTNATPVCAGGAAVAGAFELRVRS